MNNIFKNLQLFDMSPTLLRSKFFYKNLLKERESYWRDREALISKEDVSNNMRIVFKKICEK